MLLGHSLFISQKYYLDMFNYLWEYAMNLDFKNTLVALIFGLLCIFNIFVHEATFPQEPPCAEHNQSQTKI